MNDQKCNVDKNPCETVAVILLRYDPMRIKCGDNSDEYAPEAKTIMSRIDQAVDTSGLKTIIIEEFQHWFDVDLTQRMQASVLDDLVQEIWNMASQSILSTAKEY